jgi:hypothetical protein
MVWLYPLVAKDSKYVTEAIAQWFTVNRSPHAIYCDNRGEFEGDFDYLCDHRHPAVPRIRGRPYHPQSQGSIEVANRIFKRKPRAFKRERGGLGRWVYLLPLLQEIINTTVSRMLLGHVTPFEVWFNRKPH